MAENDITLISIGAKADTKDAETRIGALSRKLKELQDVSKNSVSSASAKSIKALAEAVKSIGKLGSVNISKSLPGRITALGDSIRSLSDVNVGKLREIADSLGKIAKYGGNAPSSIPKTISLSTQKNGKGNMDDVTKETDTASGAIEELGETVKTSSYAWNFLAESIKKTLSVLGQVSLVASKKIGGMMGNLAITPWKSLATSIGSATKRLSGFFSALKRIAIYRAIRTALKEITQGFREGMQNLYRYSELIDGKFKQSMDSLATSALYAKNSLGAMVAPIVNALAPAVDMLVDKFVELLNTINELFATLTGASTWTKALKYPKEYMEATDGASGSAKKLRATLLGFDEINRLDDNNKGGRGSASDELDYSKMFEEQNVSEKAKGVIQRIKDAFSSANFTDIGFDLGKIIKDSLDKINWNSVKQKTKNVGSSLATLINGFISVPNLADSMGNTVAEAINTWAGNINNFFGKVEWNRLGSFIAEGFNKAIKTIDVKELASSLTAPINGAFKSLNSFFDRVDWKAFGSFIGRGITNFFDSLDAKSISGTISKGVIGCIKSASEALKKTDFDAIGKKIGQMIEGIDWGEVFANIGTLIGDAIKKVPNLLAGAGHIVDALVKGILGIIPKLPSIAWDIISNFMLALGNLYEIVGRAGASFISNWISGAKMIWSDIKKFASDMIDKIGEGLNDAWDSVYEWGKKVVSTFVAGMKAKWRDLKENVSEWWHGILGDLGFETYNVTYEDNTPTTEVTKQKPNLKNAGGGHYYTPYANGGSVQTGDLFLANEKEPELIGHVGNRTQVANNDQITESIRVATAQGNAESNMLLREAVSALQALLNKDTVVVAEVTTDSITSGLARQNRRNGRTVIPVGG